MAASPRASLLLALAIALCLGLVAWLVLDREMSSSEADALGGWASDGALESDAMSERSDASGSNSARLDRSAPEAGEKLPPDRRRVRGRLLDASGQPAVDAWIGEISSLEPSIPGEDGRFELFVANAQTRLELLAIAADHAPARLERALEATPQPIELGDLALTSGGAIRGRVLDEAGKPLPDVVVRLKPGIELAWLQALDFEQVLPAAHTDPDGAFAFAHLAPGSYGLTAQFPGKLDALSAANVTEGGTSEPNPIVIRAAHELFGRVIDPEGRPVLEAAVRAGTTSWAQNILGSASSAADGTFRIANLPASPIWVEAQKPGFSKAKKAGVDASRGEELVLQLEAGLRVTGVVVDAETRSPIERFAVSARRTGDLEAQTKGAPTQQVARRLAALREEIARTTEDAERARKQRLEAEMVARLARVTELARTRPIASRAEGSEAEAHAEGRFALESLDEGLYTIDVEAPSYAPAAAEAVEVRRGAAPPELSLELAKIPTLTGLVVEKPGGAPIEGARVELHRVIEPGEEQRRVQRSLYGWIFAPAGPRGVIVATARANAEGRFEIRGAEGRAVLSVRAAGRADHETETFEPTQVSRELRIELGACAQLRGRVRDAPAASGELEIVALGGRGALLTTKAAADRTYRFERLQPGSYLVRAFPAGQRAHFNRFFSGLFPLHAGAVDPSRVPPPDVVLAEGESRTFDVALELPPAGSVQGALTLNGQPAQGASAVLRPIDAPGAGTLSIQAVADERGSFAMLEVPAGKYGLELTGPTRQILHTEELRIDAGTATRVERDLSAGGVRGRVVASEPVAEADLRGIVWILPGATEAPADLSAYRKLARTHRLRVRDGKFEDAALTPGPALAIAEITGWKRCVRAIAIPASGMEELQIELAGRSSQ